MEPLRVVLVLQVQALERSSKLLEVSQDVQNVELVQMRQPREQESQALLLKKALKYFRVEYPS